MPHSEIEKSLVLIFYPSLACGSRNQNEVFSLSWFGVIALRGRRAVFWMIVLKHIPCTAIRNVPKFMNVEAMFSWLKVIYSTINHACVFWYLQKPITWCQKQWEVQCWKLFRLVEQQTPTGVWTASDRHVIPSVVWWRAVDCQTEIGKAVWRLSR